MIVIMTLIDISIEENILPKCDREVNLLYVEVDDFFALKSFFYQMESMGSHIHEGNENTRGSATMMHGFSTK